jgi:hypothetical protein
VLDPVPALIVVTPVNAPLLRVTPPIELVVPGAVISLANSVIPPIELLPVPALMTPVTFKVESSHLSPEFALIVPGLPDVVIT